MFFIGVSLMQGIDKILIYPISFNQTLNNYNPV